MFRILDLYITVDTNGTNTTNFKVANMKFRGTLTWDVDYSAHDVILKTVLIFFTRKYF